MSTLTLALVQSSLHWLDKSANLTHFSEQLNNLNEQVDLIVLPETFATGFAINLDCSEPEQGDVLSWLQATAKQKNAVIAGSVLVAKGDKKANRFYWVWPNGEVKYYDKRHLFCLGNEGNFVAAGTQREIFTINDFRNSR